MQAGLQESAPIMPINARSYRPLPPGSPHGTFPVRITGPARLGPRQRRCIHKQELCPAAQSFSHGADAGTEHLRSTCLLRGCVCGRQCGTDAGAQQQDATYLAALLIAVQAQDFELPDCRRGLRVFCRFFRQEFPIGRARSELDFAPRVSFAEGMARSVAWVRSGEA